MGLSNPRAKYLETIAFQPVKWLGINTMGLSDPWGNYLDIIVLKPVKKY